MAFRPSRLARLDRLVLGAAPEKLAQQKEIPAAAPRALTAEQSERMYVLNYRHQWPGGRPLTPAEQLERQRLIALACGRRK
jgi:hypothetical protein